ncbi:MAG: hypothetical protein OXI43_01155 [Candidatus Poribacteria bacterium]|nr:hypothetical protein [Candidatus Poribacteria bacterium]
MNEELEQSEEIQLNEKLEQSEEDHSQLIEIYKLQSQLANSISNRRFTINRFYILVMSGLVLIFPAFFKLPEKIQGLVAIEYLITGLALLGITISLAWFISINSNLRLNMIKYEALKNLEDELKYQFFKDEWKFLEKYGKHRTYWEISYIEILVPILFFLISSLLLFLLSTNSPGKLYFIIISYPSAIVGFICGSGFQSWQIDREIRGLERWTNKKINRVSFAIMLAYLSFMVFLPNLIDSSFVNIKEAESINENPQRWVQKKLQLNKLFNLMESKGNL